MSFFLYLLGLYCLVDTFLVLRFNTRLSPASLRLSPVSFWSSAKKVLPLFLFFAAALWFSPPLSIALILFAHWPHPFLTAYRELKQKKPNASFPLHSPLPQGDKLFCIATDDRPHILFIVLESFRAKNIGSLGAKFPLSPHFDRLAKEGILFSNFHSTGNLTNRAVIASLFGIPAAHKAWHLGHYCKLTLTGLPEIFAKHGYHPALIQGGSTGFDHEAEFFERHGFKTILGKRDIAKPGTSWGVYDEYLMPFAASWLSEQKSPVFLNLYTITNHHPWTHPEGSNGFLPTFAYTDQALGKLIEDLKNRDLLKKSILFIFGDHGHRIDSNVDQDLYQDNIHVPLLIYAEGRIQTPQKIETVSSQIDLLPTLLDLMHFDDPHHSLGKSLLRPSDTPIYFSHPFDEPVRGCRQGDLKYIAGSGWEKQFDLKIDPEEKEGMEICPLLREMTDHYFNQLDEFYSDRPSEKSEGTQHLNFDNSIKIDDEALEEIARAHPNLSSISLANCLLLTDLGIGALLYHCPKLEKLCIDGIDEITASNWAIPSHLVELKALNCPQLKIDWISQLPSLRTLYFGPSPMTDADLLTLEKTQKNLIAIYFSHLYHITDQGLKPLLESNLELSVLFLRGCQKITPKSIDAIQSKVFRYKFITDT